MQFIKEKKDIFIVIGLIALAISIVFATINLTNIYKENKISKSPLEDNKVFYNNLANTITELNADTFLIISYVQDRKVYNNEKQIKKLMDEYGLLDNMQYIDASKYRDDETFLPGLNSVLGLEGELEIKKMPAVIYFKDGVPEKTVDSSSHLLNATDFKNIIIEYNLGSE